MRQKHLSVKVENDLRLNQACDNSVMLEMSSIEVNMTDKIKSFLAQIDQFSKTRYSQGFSLLSLPFHLNKHNRKYKEAQEWSRML